MFALLSESVVDTFVIIAKHLITISVFSQRLQE